MAENNVVNLADMKAKKPEYCYTCNNCECQHFFLLSGGEVQCRGCSYIFPDLKWGEM